MLPIFLSALVSACPPPVTNPPESKCPGYHEPCSQLNGDTLPPGRVVLTYDDGPGANTFRIAQYLSDQGVQATFFVCGCRFEGRPEPSPAGAHACETAPTHDVTALQRLVAMGHRVASHSQDHACLTNLALPDALNQLRSLQQILDPAIQDGLFYFRGPWGGWNPTLQAALNADPYLTKLRVPFHWTVNGKDYQCLAGSSFSSIEACADAFPFNTVPRQSGAVLLHDRLEDIEHTCRTYQLTQELIPRLRSLGYIIVPLDAIPGTLGPRRFSSQAPLRSTVFSDAATWNTSPSYYLSIQLGDIDGDGDADICGRSHNGVWCQQYSGGTFGTARRWTTGFGNPTYQAAAYGSTLRLADLDNDGDSDICVRGSAGVYCALSNAISPGVPSLTFGPITRWSQAIDFSDADGWASLPSYYESIQLADVTGDGRADLCGRSRLGVRCAVSTGSGFLASTRWVRQYLNEDGWDNRAYGSTLRYGDLNGDQRADVCGRGPEGLYCALSSGSSFSSPTLWLRGPFSDLDGWASSSSKYLSLALADVDNDGLADACGRNDTGVVCAFSEAGQDRFRGYQYLANELFTDAQAWGTEPYGATLRFADLNQDGRADVCGRDHAGIRCALAEGGLNPLPPQPNLPPLLIPVCADPITTP